MGIKEIIALIGGIGLIFALAPALLVLSDDQVQQKADSLREVQAFQQRFGPISPTLQRSACCTTYVTYIANGSFAAYAPYDTAKQDPSWRILQLTITVEPWITKTSMMCVGAGVSPTTLEADVQTITTTKCLDKDLTTNY